jgi:6-phosphofructokinase 1
MSPEIQRIAINTGGGDAPGLNAVIRAAVLAAERRRWEIIGICRGYEGLIDTRQTILLDRESVRGITHLGGTILGTSNRGDPFGYPVESEDGTIHTVDRSHLVVENFRKLGLDALIAIGGDGSMRIAHELSLKGLPIVGVPKTIDNDLAGTVVTFGFNTAVTIATEAVDRLHSTAEAHNRVFTIEVMGRYAGWIALHAGMAGGADVILIPEISYDIDAVCRKIQTREARGRRFSLVVVAEGARALQRGGWPTSYDRVLAQRFGAAAVRVIAKGHSGVMVALDPPTVRTVPLAEATRRMKTVPLDSDTICTAREMGISLGD